MNGSSVPKIRWNHLRFDIYLYDALKRKLLVRAYPKVEKLIGHKHEELLEINKKFRKIILKIVKGERQCSKKSKKK